MYFNRWDIVEAWYLYLRDGHTGQGSLKYRRLSKLLAYYKPNNAKISGLTPNGKEIYRSLVIGSAKVRRS